LNALIMLHLYHNA